MDNELLAAKVLFSLARKRKWGESHTAYENVLRQFKSESLGKHGQKLANEAAKRLLREGFILGKQAHYGFQVSLNPRMAQEIKAIIRERLGFEL